MLVFGCCDFVAFDAVWLLGLGDFCFVGVDSVVVILFCLYGDATFYVVARWGWFVYMICVVFGLLV